MLDGKCQIINIIHKIIKNKRAWQKRKNKRKKIKKERGEGLDSREDKPIKILCQTNITKCKLNFCFWH